MRLSSGLGASITIPASMVDALTNKIVTAATPQVVALLNQEKATLQDAAFKSLPFIGGSIAVFLGTFFLVPGDRTAIKVTGYLVSAGLLVGSAAMFFSALNAASAPPTPTAAGPEPSSYTVNFSL